MKVNELSREELTELKARHYADLLDESEGRCPSYGEIAMIDDLVADEEVFAEYDCIDFAEDDFFCNLEGGVA